ncbi:hypothetical protein ACIRD2_32090 [Streptomyces sp. NPDC093595]|uniref:hypothetical protein n=1 Tax=Streptomyces sp. NPDC093595 TaxID=3366045 RepID=UPI00381269EF
MSTAGPAASGGVRLFDELMAEVTAATAHFDHRAHLHLTWLAVRRVGMPAAVGLVGEGIRRTARSAGAPQKYHATLSRAWVELVAYHAADRPTTEDFAAFVERHPLLLDKHLLTRFYHSTTLAGARARTDWVAPDRAPFPWHSGGRPIEGGDRPAA